VKRPVPPAGFAHDVMNNLFKIACLAACLTPVWAKTTLELSIVCQPSTTFIVGPGTIVSVHLLDLPFIAPRYVVKFKTDDDELIEVWHAGKDIQVLQGMYGMLTYSTHPEIILSFRVVEQTLPK
jgi:hypothetical protein